MEDSTLLRFSRHILLPELDIQGQNHLLASHIGVVGCGGLGCAALYYLAASGIGHLTLIDHDTIELSNLSRQILFNESHLGKPKAQCAADQLKAQFPLLHTQIFTEKLAIDNALDQLANCDLILDCSDNMPTRRLVNQCANQLGIPLVSGSASRIYGQLMVYDPKQANSGCYECLFSEIDTPDDKCSEFGVLSPLVGTIGSLQALEAVCILSRWRSASINQLTLFNAKTLHWQHLQFGRQANCSCCSAR